MFQLTISKLCAGDCFILFFFKLVQGARGGCCDLQVETGDAISHLFYSSFSTKPSSAGTFVVHNKSKTFSLGEFCSLLCPAFFVHAVNISKILRSMGCHFIINYFLVATFLFFVRKDRLKNFQIGDNRSTLLLIKHNKCCFQGRVYSEL